MLIGGKSVQPKMDEVFSDQCKQAKSLVKKHSKIPDLGEYIPQAFPKGMIDTTKYLLELDI